MIRPAICRLARLRFVTFFPITNKIVKCTNKLNDNLSRNIPGELIFERNFVKQLFVFFIVFDNDNSVHDCLEYIHEDFNINRAGRGGGETSSIFRLCGAVQTNGILVR